MAFLAGVMQNPTVVQLPGRSGPQGMACLSLLRAEHAEGALACARLPQRQRLQWTEHAGRASGYFGRPRRDREFSGRPRAGAGTAAAAAAAGADDLLPRSAPSTVSAAAAAGAEDSQPRRAPSKAAALRSLIRSPEIVEVPSTCSARATHWQRMFASWRQAFRAEGSELMRCTGVVGTRLL